MVDHLNLPGEIQAALQRGAALIISLSGGKDSDAMVYTLLEARQEMGWTGEVIAFHSDLGRAEWRESLPYIQRLCGRLGIKLVVQRRIRYDVEFDLFDEIELRRMSMDAKGKQDQPHWPSSAARYCTKSQKEQVCDTWIRHYFPEDAEVVVAMGLRDQESPARAKKADCWTRESTAITLRRFTYSWLPIRQMKLEDVWAKIGYTLAELKTLQDQYQQAKRDGDLDTIGRLEEGFKANWAYLRGNERLSCACCVLASVNDLLNGAEYTPEAYRWLVAQEIKTGFSFTAKLWLGTLRPDLLTEEQRAFYKDK